MKKDNKAKARRLARALKREKKKEESRHRWEARERERDMRAVGAVEVIVCADGTVVKLEGMTDQQQQELYDQPGAEYGFRFKRLVTLENREELEASAREVGMSLRSCDESGKKIIS